MNTNQYNHSVDEEQDTVIRPHFGDEPQSEVQRVVPLEQVNEISAQPVYYVATSTAHVEQTPKRSWGWVLPVICLVFASTVLGGIIGAEYYRRSLPTQPFTDESPSVNLTANDNVTEKALQPKTNQTKSSSPDSTAFSSTSVSGAPTKASQRESSDTSALPNSEFEARQNNEPVRRQTEEQSTEESNQQANEEQPAVEEKIERPSDRRKLDVGEISKKPAEVLNPNEKRTERQANVIKSEKRVVEDEAPNRNPPQTDPFFD